MIIPRGCSTLFLLLVVSSAAASCCIILLRSISSSGGGGCDWFNLGSIGASGLLLLGVGCVCNSGGVSIGLLLSGICGATS